MRSISHRSARSPHEFRRWVRLSVATITSTALVGGAVVAAPPHPLNPLTQVAQAQETNTLLPADVSTAEGALIDLALLAESGAIDESGLELLEAIQSEQAWPQDAGEGPNTGDINLELLQALNLNVDGLTLPLVNNGTNGGLLELGTDGVGALNSYANAPGIEDVRAAAGAVTEGGALNLDPTTGEGSLDTTIHLTALAQQLGLSGLTELAVNELSLRVGAAATTLEKSGDTVDPQYNLADAQLTIGSDLVGEISTGLQDTVTELETGVNDLLGGEGVANSLLGVLGPVLGLVGIDDPEITASVDLQDTLDSLLFEPLYEGATPEESLVNIDLTSGEIIVNLENLHDGDLNNLPANTELVNAAQLEEITQTVNELLGTLTARISDALNEGLLDTQLTITLPDVRPLGLLPLGNITIDATLGGLLDTEGYADPVIDGDGVLGEVSGLLDALTDVLQPIGGVIQGVLEGPVDGLVDTLLGTDGPVTSLLDGLSPLLDEVLGTVVNATVNNQTDLENGLRVSALDVSLLNLVGTELASLPLATSTVTSPSQAQIDDDVFAPSITTLDPDSGAIAGGDTVTIEGANLVSIDPETDEPISAVTEVNFGDAVITGDGITANTDGSITVTTPAVNAAGEVQVTVVTAAGTSNALPFTYTETVAGDPSPLYEDATAPAGEDTTSEVSYTDEVPEPEGTTYALADDFTIPEGWSVDIDEATGTVTATPAPAGADGADEEVLEVPVTVTYLDDNIENDSITAVFNLDTDGDGIPDNEDEDDDGDGYTDDEEEEAGTDPKDPEDTPAEGDLVITGTPLAVDPTNDEQPTGLTLENFDDTTVTATDEDGEPVTDVRIDDDGDIVITPGEGVDGPITLTVTDESLPAGEETFTLPVNGHTAGEDDDNDGEDAPSVGGTPNEVEPTDEEQDTGLNLEDGTEDTEVTARDEDDQDIPVDVDDEGNISVTPGEDVDGPITIIVDDPALDEPIEVDVPVAGHEEGRDDNGDGNPPTDGEDAPGIGGTPNEVEPTDEEQDTGLDLTDPTEDTDVTARDEDDQEIDVDVDDDGNIIVTPGEDVDGPITVIVDDPALDEPIEVEVPVADHEEGRDDNNSGGVETGVTVGSSDSWLSSIAGLFVGLLGIGGIFAGIMEFMHQNGMLGQAEDLWWLNITNR